MLFPGIGKVKWSLSFAIAGSRFRLTSSVSRSYPASGQLPSNGIFYRQVETIGDAYVVVGGLPTFTEHHADDVVSMAFGMVEVTEMVTSPADNQPIKVRYPEHN